MPKVVMKLYKIRIITTPKIANGGILPSFKVFCKYTEFYDSIKHQKPQFVKGEPHFDIIPGFKGSVHHGGAGHDGHGGDFKADNQVLIYDDVKIEFY